MREQFIQMLKDGNIKFRDKGHAITILHDKDISLLYKQYLPNGVRFFNQGVVQLPSMKALAHIDFVNNGLAHLNNVDTILDSVSFFNNGDVFLSKVRSIAPGTIFNNNGDIFIPSTAKTEGVIFNQTGEVKFVDK